LTYYLNNYFITPPEKRINQVEKSDYYSLPTLLRKARRLAGGRISVISNTNGQVGAGFNLPIF